MFSSKLFGTVLAAAALALVGCGGAGDSGSVAVDGTSKATTTATPPAPTRQTLAVVGTTAATTTPTTAPSAAEPYIAVFPGRGEFRSATPLATLSLASLTAAANDFNNRVAGITPRYAVSTWRVEYLTLDGFGRLVLASGLVAVPQKPAGSLSPVLSYQHGTIFKNAEAPSVAIAANEPPIAIASLGYIVLAPDYVGFGSSYNVVQHPYLLSEPAAATVVDFLTATRIWRQAVGLRGNGQLFMVGYSQGGHVTMAAHRAMQATGNPHIAQLVASVGGSGPYDVGMTLDKLQTKVREDNALLGALIKPGFLGSLGSAIRNEVRRAIMRIIVPDDADVSFQTTFLDNFLADDVGAIVRMSNVHEWRPERPFRLFHGREDIIVSYDTSLSALSAMRARGAPPSEVSLHDCTTTPPDHLKCVPEFFRRAADYFGSMANNL
jgi:hypothetical protein